MNFELRICQCILALALSHYGYSVSMTESGQYFIQGYIGTLIPVCLACLMVACEWGKK